MPIFATLAVVWLAGAFITKFIRGNGMDDGAGEKKDGAPTQLQLDALKAIRESAFQRWDKRRGYEWQLSISIWTALAAFSALVLNKDFPITDNHTVARWVGGFGSAIIAAHGYYLWIMFCHTIGDGGILRWAEQQIAHRFLESVDPTLRMPRYVRKQDKNGAIQNSRFLMYPNLSRYGIVQVIITTILVAGAVGAILARNTVQPPKQDTTTTLRVTS